MISVIQKILNHRVGSDKLDWDNRNLRIMNGMSLLLAASLSFFTVLAIVQGFNHILPLTIIGVFFSCLYFFIPNNMGLGFLKIYWCVLPVLISYMYAVLGVGKDANDVYYVLLCSVLPLIVFKEKNYYVPLILFSTLAFLSLYFTQQLIDPFLSLTPEELSFYKNTNHVFFVIFLLAMFGLFKSENSVYQEEIEFQKKLIEEQNKEVKQSIEYAKTIQEAILPSSELFHSSFSKSFILYCPKDIVAGDFYWMEKSGDWIFFAVADCTGHGVPGAMVSVICNNALNKSIKQYGLHDTGKILDQTRESVIATFDDSSREVKDGMDIAFCAFNQKTKRLFFSGANNPLYLVRNGELTEFKGSKQPVGNFENSEAFKQVEIEVVQGDRIYLFTDGFADQFGGSKGKKYKYKPFKNYILSLQHLPIQEHKNKILDEFENWKGDLEQVDDLCIIGIEFDSDLMG